VTLAFAVLSSAFAGELAERRAYEAAVQAATAEVRIYDGWYTALLARATLLTPELVAQQEARIAFLTGDAAAARPAPAGIEVVLAAQSNWKEALQVAGDGSAPWTVSLLAGARNCAGNPEVEFVKKPGELDRTLFPHLTEWDRMFRLRWAADACAGASPTGMRILGAHGRGEFVWSR
jgi:hypothetical protein